MSVAPPTFTAAVPVSTGPASPKRTVGGTRSSSRSVRKRAAEATSGNSHARPLSTA